MKVEKLSYQFSRYVGSKNLNLQFFMSTSLIKQILEQLDIINFIFLNYILKKLFMQSFKL